jgi:hypothetical protein
VASVTDLIARLVTRLRGFQLRQLVLDLKLFAFQLVQALIVGARMELFFLDFLLDRLMTTLEFDNMTL